MKKKVLLLSIISILCLTSCDRKGSWQSFTIQDEIIGYDDTNCTIGHQVDPFNTSMVVRYFFDKKNKNADEIKNNIINIYTDEIIRFHKLFDRHYYYADSNGNLINNLKVINESYGTNEEIQIDKDLYDCLKFCYSSYSLTNGMFNIFTGGLTDFWEGCFSSYNNYMDVYDYDPYVNNDAKTRLENLVSAIPNTLENYNNQLTFNEENYSVKFNNILNSSSYRPYISLGGIAKGYATDKVKQKLIDNGYKDGILFSGGSSLESLSEPIYTKKSGGMSIETRDPNSFDGSAFSIKVSNQFNYSTSGNYTVNKHYCVIDGVLVLNRHHIINPFTGYPESYYRSVSILSYSLSSAYLDILSTALMNMSIEEGMKLRKDLNYQFDTFYLVQKYNNGNLKDYSLKVHYTNNVNNTLELANGIEGVYEK